MWRPVFVFHREPARFIRTWSSVLQVASAAGVDRKSGSTAA
jgi:hypothetical protein